MEPAASQAAQIVASILRVTGLLLLIRPKFLDEFLNLGRVVMAVPVAAADDCGDDPGESGPHLGRSVALIVARVGYQGLDPTFF